MALTYLPNGNLIPGIHLITWQEFVQVYGYVARRRDLIEGLSLAIQHLSQCGCTTIFIDGSFVTKKRNPGDYDVCWDRTHVDFQTLNVDYAVIACGTKEMQKRMYGGELRLANFPADFNDRYIDFFQKDKEDGSAKGILKLKI